MKKIIFVCMLILIMSTTVFASDVNVQINGENVNFTDSEGQTVNAQIINDRTMVPMRKIFEVLGATVEWDGENRIVTGTKDEISVQLQIDNTIATKTINGVTEEIILDTPPMLVDSRTMVPLRFIAESLEKQVGWDSENRTAVIIDYEYFGERLNEKLPALYTFLKKHNEKNIFGDYDYYNVKFTNKYYDFLNETKNTEITINARASVKDNFEKITLNISGTDGLSKEIISEGWNSVGFDLTYDDEKILLNTDNEIIKDMFKIRNTAFSTTYDELMLDGSVNLKKEKMFEIWAGINDNQIKSTTFSELKNDFDSLCNLFASQGLIYETSIRYTNYNIKYFDLAKLDNFVYDNEYLKVYNIINRLFFKSDVSSDEMLYDTNNIKVKIEVKNNYEELNITIEATNDYNEKNEYIINFQRIK